ncbi:protein ELC-like [Andrographis paniculata]|uniref:protein ELC-like n=1 Tax=Andrographis paniculata TaxID=175694 RepID=UPI0021E8C18A|nr:protein ELC-like [Andrographis paniculata]
MPTTSFSPAQFIDDALFCTTQNALSYTHHKWTIRHHLISLFHNFPFLRPSLATFTHNDGAAVKLLAASGSLPVAASAAAVPITIWVHELYPHARPIVYVDTPVLHSIHDSHPFVDRSGNTTSSYLVNWRHDRSNLTDLVRSLITLFNLSHPFCHGGLGLRFRRPPPTLSKTEALDRLTCSVYYDLRAAAAASEVEIRRLAAVQVELRDRAAVAEAVIGELAGERRALEERVEMMCEESDRVLNWVGTYGGAWVSDIDEVFEGLEEAAEAVAEWRAAEDVVYALEKAVENGVLGIGEFLKQVRILGRQQFLLMDKILRVKSDGKSVFE